MSRRTFNSVISSTVQITMARCIIPFGTDKAMPQHCGMDRMSLIAFPSVFIVIKSRNNAFVCESQEKKAKTSSSSQKL